MDRRLVDAIGVLAGRIVPTRPQTNGGNGNGSVARVVPARDRDIAEQLDLLNDLDRPLTPNELDALQRLEAGQNRVAQMIREAAKLLQETHDQFASTRAWDTVAGEMAQDAGTLGLPDKNRFTRVSKALYEARDGILKNELKLDEPRVQARNEQVATVNRLLKELAQAQAELTGRPDEEVLAELQEAQAKK